jgi:hypothetical protein
MSDCKHIYRARIGKYEAVCIRCLERVPVNKGTIKAPEDWAQMSQGSLAVWYVRRKWGVNLSGHLASYEEESSG